MHDKFTRKPKICEINARFPLNGFLITYLGLHDSHEYFSCFNSGEEIYKPIFNENYFFECFKSHFDLSKPIGIIKKREVLIFSIY